ncbi:unnamed protein product [Rhizoctonia solani]|uniref:Transmembrane protein n=1 Tax=Rhizoctonia solani TaxID=456999 RepID=A0A8H3BUX4_9AGAM|nr:unnamed protein product [Rhizoctonia solani]
MSLSAPSRPWILILQFWVSISRLIIALYESIVICYQINIIRNWSSDESIILPDSVDVETFVLLSSQLGLWIILTFNDIYMSVIDFRRTNTFIGCVATQASISIVAIIITSISVFTRRGWAPLRYIPGPFGGQYQSYGPRFFLFTFPTALGIFYSVCLLIIAVFPAILYDEYVPLGQTWKSNTKNFLMGTVGPHMNPVLSFTGQPRISRVSASNELYAPGNVMSRFLSPVLFRRVSPTETKSYAFTRNLFSLVSICVLAFRTITALQKAQNQMGTKLTSGSCDWGVISEDHNLALLLAMPNWTAMNRDPLRVTVAKEEVQLRPEQGREKVHCEQVYLQNCASNDIKYVHPYHRVFSCQSSVSLKDYRNLVDPVTYHIEVRSDANVSIVNKDMPEFWLSNALERLSPPKGSSEIAEDERRCHNPFYGHVAWSYMPSWRLNPGYHVEAEAQLTTRRFITSSVIRDIILNSEPEYSHTSLYPIIESGTSALSNYTVATAKLRVTLKPAYAYLPNSAMYHNIDQYSREPNSRVELCTFIQDYRESSIFDVLGSVGGLFALLQAAHVLLFGRPMLWGLTGAKLITPFGIFGACGSRDFRRRLRERYHREPTRENPETLRIGAFLRDFVIELGPADLEPDRSAVVSSETLSLSASSTGLKEMTDGRTSLLPLEAQKSSNFEKGNETPVPSHEQEGDVV